MLIVMGTVTGLPATGCPVRGSIALITTFVVTVVPPANPAVLRITLIEVVVPPTTSYPKLSGERNNQERLWQVQQSSLMRIHHYL